MRIATLNVNSIRARLETLRTYFQEQNFDVLCLQEIKCQEQDFPFDFFKDMGYHIELLGQKSYNGVALLSRFPMHNVTKGIPGLDDEQARFIGAFITPPDFTHPFYIASCYIPNGNPCPGDKFTYKLTWLEHFNQYAKNLLTLDIPIILAGDYNICPEEWDLHHPERFKDNAIFHIDARSKWRHLKSYGYGDAFRLLNPDKKHHYSYWDYTAGSFAKDHGLRIDHFMISPHAADYIQSCDIDKTPRSFEKASDHTPVIATFAP